jgi:uncharacterized damage-inducible protein DinB
MTTFFKELFEYTNHFNQKLIEIFLEHTDKTSEKCIKLFNHTLNAHQIWNCRIELNKNTYGVWEIHPPQEYMNIAENNYQGSIIILDKFDLNKVIQYSNTKGQVFNNSIRDILFHVINHSTYHRGQIASDLRERGLEPLITDYIFYKR